MTSNSSKTTPAAIDLSYAGNKSSSQIIESVPLSLIKVPDKPVKPPSPRAITLCKANLHRYGQPRPIIVADDHTVLEGLEFVLAAREMGWTHINVVRLSGLSNTDMKILTLWLAKLPHISSWDDEALRYEFQEIINIDSDLIDLTGFSMGEVDVILDPEVTKDKVDPLDAVPETPSADQVVSRPGDMFLLGDHKILCGDSQKRESFDKLMGTQKARAVITDPPYNIKIKNNVSGLGKTKHDDFAMGVGEMSFDTFTEFLSLMFVLSSNGLVPGGLMYIFMDRRHLEELFAAARKAKLKLFDLAIWDKGSGGMGGMYRSQIETCGVSSSGMTRISTMCDSAAMAATAPMSGRTVACHHLEKAVLKRLQHIPQSSRSIFWLTSSRTALNAAKLLLTLLQVLAAPFLRPRRPDAAVFASNLNPSMSMSLSIVGRP